MSKKYINKQFGKARGRRASLSIAGIGATMSFEYVSKQETIVECPMNDASNLLTEVDPAAMASTNTGKIKDAAMITVTNVSNQTACLAVTYPDWTLGTNAADSYGSAVSVIQQLLKPGASYIMPELRAVCTSTVTTSAANGKFDYGFDGGAKDSTDERPLQIHPLQNQLSGAKLYTNAQVNVDADTIITDQFGSFNYNLEDAPGSGLTTGIGNGNTGLFNLSGGTSTQHYVPGSICVRFYDKAYVEFGLNNITSTTKTGLATNTKYRFELQTDGGTNHEVKFTTDTRDTTFGTGLGNVSVLGKINTAIRALDPWKDQAGNIIPAPQFALYNGDVRMATSTAKKDAFDPAANKTLLHFKNGATATYTDVWGVGLFPAFATVNSNFSKPRLKELTRTSEMMFDDGFGKLVIGNKVVGDIDYQTGWISFAGAPKWSSVEYTAHYESALGGNNFSDVLKATPRNNYISAIRCHSTNIMRPAKIKLTVFTI